MHFFTIIINLLILFTIMTTEANKVDLQLNNRNLPGVYMIEFATDSTQIQGMSTIKDHLKGIGIFEDQIIERTSTKTDLCQGYSFEILGDYNYLQLESHLSSLPDFRSIHKVSIIFDV